MSSFSFKNAVFYIQVALHLKSSTWNGKHKRFIIRNDGEHHVSFVSSYVYTFTVKKKKKTKAHGVKHVTYLLPCDFVFPFL